MMMMLRDDRVIELFSSPQAPPAWIEGIDIENHEYLFCDTNGQRYHAVITTPGGAFRQPGFRLDPVGNPAIANAVEVVDQALGIEDNEIFKSLDSLRRSIGDAPRDTL